MHWGVKNAVPPKLVLFAGCMGPAPPGSPGGLPLRLPHRLFSCRRLSWRKALGRYCFPGHTRITRYYITFFRAVKGGCERSLPVVPSHFPRLQQAQGQHIGARTQKNAQQRAPLPGITSRRQQAAQQQRPCVFRRSCDPVLQAI